MDVKHESKPQPLGGAHLQKAVVTFSPGNLLFESWFSVPVLDYLLPFQ